MENGFDNELAVSWTTESDSRCLTKSPLGEGCAVAQNFNSEYTGEVCLTLSVLPWHSMVAAPCQELLNFIVFGASSIPPLQRICPCLPKTWAKHARTLSQAVLPSTFGIMTSARIASPCFTRPRFELGLSSRVPQVSAKRVRLSCFLKSRVLSSIHHDVLDIDLSTQHLSSSPSHSQRFVSSTIRS